MREDNDENKLLYGSALSNRDIVTGSVPVPAAAHELITALSRF